VIGAKILMGTFRLNSSFFLRINITLIEQALNLISLRVKDNNERVATFGRKGKKYI